MEIKSTDGSTLEMSYQVGAFLSCALVCFYQNLYCWCKFGILRHNEFFSIRDGSFKRFAFMKTGVCSSVLIICVAHLVFNHPRHVDWGLVFSIILFCSLISRFYFFNQCISGVQIAGVIMLLGAISCQYYNSETKNPAKPSSSKQHGETNSETINPKSTSSHSKLAEF